MLVGVTGGTGLPVSGAVRRHLDEGDEARVLSVGDPRCSRECRRQWRRLWRSGIRE